MPTLTVAMIVKNEAEVLSRCLDCASKLADEIVVVDTGSTDETKKIALRYTDKVYDFVWVDDFSAARNYSFSKATRDLVMWLDADDIIDDGNLALFNGLKKLLPPTVDAVMARYNSGFDGQGRVTFSYYRERIVRRAAGFLWVEPVHEYIATSGNIIRAEAAVTHGKPKEREDAPSARNINIYRRQIERGITLSPRAGYYYGRELVVHGLYGEAIEALSEFLNNGQGWSEDNVHACEQLSFCHYALGNRYEAKRALLRAFLYAAPRGEVCCKIAALYADDGDYAAALMWYDFAASLKLPDDVLGFIEPEYYGYIPLIEAAVCADKLGRTELAAEYNERAAVYRPDSPSVKYNREYFGRP